MAAECDCVVGHNCDFDRQFVPDVLRSLPHKPWCCTQLGIEWPRQIKSGGTLISLMLEHGLGVVDPHRALNDCMAIARLFARCSELGFDVAKMVEQGCEPRITIQALVSYANKDKARERGFHWESDRKRWVRSIRAGLANDLPFKWKEVDP
jgi:DNA polymerase-3 subunit epsilon